MIDNNSVSEIIGSYGTPVYVFDENEVISRAEKIRDMLGTALLCYSVKANPFLIPALIPVVRYFEVCSPGELQICKNLRVPPEKIIYSGVHKESSDIEDAMKLNVAIITAESLRQWSLICEAAKKLDTRSDVILRLSSNNQFGMSVEDIRTILSNPSGNATVIGLHYFAGTDRKQNKIRAEELDMLSELLCTLRSEYSCGLSMLEYGPGLPFPYFTGSDFSDTLAPLKELTKILGKIPKDITLSVEMGRFIASSCGYYITSVCDLKRSYDANWCIIDGGINHINYLGQMMGMKTPVIWHFRDDEKIADHDGQVYCICGSLCTTNDVLVRELPLNDLRIGDTLVFTNIGAYSITESFGLFLSRTLPRVVMLNDGDTRLVRDHIETWKINSRN